jgi:hypothetical protein
MRRVTQISNAHQSIQPWNSRVRILKLYHFRNLKLVPYQLSLRFHGPEYLASNADSFLSVYSDLDFQAPEALFSNDHFKNLETLKTSHYFILLYFMDQNLSLQNEDLLLSVYSDLEFQAPESIFSHCHFENLKTLYSLGSPYLQSPKLNRSEFSLQNADCFLSSIQLFKQSVLKP